MAAPNIANLTTITGETAVLVVTTSPTAIVTNSAASGKVFKINALYISNVNGTTSATVNIDLFRSSTAYRIGYLLNIPPSASLDAISKLIYLEEGDSLRITASINSYIEAVCSFEEMS